MKILPVLVLGWCAMTVSVSAAGTKLSPLGTSDDELNHSDPKAYAASLAQEADDKLQGSPSQQDLQDAAKLLDKAATLDPDNLDLWTKAGWVHLEKLHDPVAAYPYLAAVVKRRPDDVDARKLLGMACTQTGRLREALAQFQEAARLRPDDLWIEANLGRAYARLRQYGKADSIYAEVLQKDPHQPDARLGEAELEAWRGHTARALEMLDELIKENPGNVEALTLRGDVHRWRWELKEAQTDYSQALGLAQNDYEATSGLLEAKRMAASDVNLQGYIFKDTTHFLQESAGAGVRVHANDDVYLLARGAGWRFTNPGFEAVDRIDGAVGLETHLKRILEASLEGDVFDYRHEDQNGFFGGQLFTKLSPLTGFDIYTTAAYNQPFVSSMATVTNALKQESVGSGLDISLGGGFSAQNAFTLARISDSNVWWEEKPQLSYRLFGRPQTFIRAEYDYLSYKDERTNYWTPQHYQLLSPVLDTSLPLLGNDLHVDLDVRAPYVFDAHKFGFQFAGGPVVELGSWLELSASYTYNSIPGDPQTTVNRPPWSGSGGQALLRLRF
ncbi:MAG TPA: tetratricopeptide repeat protein [Verrucomicrobiae bacterium]|jgi:tetratricopeptide (TPR) repeat protein|nr:tetratricopeptide repeat protein [Verrucomicrobiae bacterium]